MNRRLRTAMALLLVSILLLSQAGHVQGTITVTHDSANNRINVVNNNLTFYFWYGAQQSPVYLNPTFAWLDNKQPSILYVVDLMGLSQFNSTQTDTAFQRNETVRNGTFSWIGNEAWSFNNFTTTQSGVTYNRLNLTLDKITNPSLSNFTYLTTNLTLGSTNYGSDPANLKFYKYSYGISQARTDVFLNMTRWKWTPNATNSNLALMLGFYATCLIFADRLVRVCGVRSLESLTPKPASSLVWSSLTIIPAMIKGPIIGPRPASSIPAIQSVTSFSPT